jgi:hypothetical protein
MSIMPFIPPSIALLPAHPSNRQAADDVLPCPEAVQKIADTFRKDVARGAASIGSIGSLD